MTVADFLRDLLGKGIRLRLEGERLISEASPGVLTPAVVDEIRERKAEIVTFLAQSDPMAPLPGAPIERLEDGERAPLSFAQQRLWFLDRMEEQSNLHNMPSTLELSGPLHKDALRRSLDAIVSRHDVLRTTFPEVDGVPYQSISPPSGPDSWEWTETDLTGRSDEGEVLELLRMGACRPFDLATGPLLRAGLFRRGPNDHLLQIVMHHTVSDGWSFGVFRNELSSLYQAFLTGTQSPLSPLPIQYADYAVWQRRRLKGEVLDGQLQYWRTKLAGLSPLDLSADRPRPPVQSFRGGTHRFQLPPALSRSLKELSGGEGSTLFMTLMAAFQVLLHHHSGQSDIAVGTPIAGRNRNELEPLIGMFVNTLVIRSEVSGQLSFREIVQQVLDTSLEAQANQDLPFEKIVEELQPQRDLSRNPLFQVFFALQNTPEVELSMPGLRVRSTEIGEPIAEFDLSLFLWEPDEEGSPGILEGSWNYAVDLFEPETIHRLDGHFQTLLEGVVADVHRPVGELPLMDSCERERLEGWCRGQEFDVQDRGFFTDLFEARTAETQDHVAVVAEDGILTYCELNSKANRLARQLQSLGVGPEVLVGVSLPRTTDTIVAVVGILKAGGAYLPLDPELPHNRLGYMLEDSAAEVLVTNSGILGAVPTWDGRVVCLDRDPEPSAVFSDLNLGEEIEADQLAYVIYTSGSTGRPKGVEVTQGNLAGYLASTIGGLDLSPDDVILALTTLSFDASVDEVFVPLSAGARIVLAPTEAVGDGNRLMTLLERTGANVMSSTPTPFRSLFMAGWKGDKNLRVWTGGEALPLDLAQELVAKCGDVWNLYGPTEATVTATRWKVPVGADQMRIGTPLANYQVYVLGPGMQQAPVGVPGELFIGGVGVARGYRGRPELTAERFVPDPFSQKPGAKLYQTGDRARFRDDGTLEFMGRLDRQVKIRGLRIELGEIEAVLAEHDSVRQVAVLAHGEGSEARLAAYIVFEDGPGFDLRGMRHFLRSHLPDYMAPSLLFELNEFPLLLSGKVDRDALPQPDTLVSSGADSFVAPRTATEEALANIWAEVLGLDQVGVTDDFFGLGGHSLLATQVISRVARDMGVEMPLRSLFESPTVAELTERILGMEPDESTSILPIRPTNREPRPPLSFAQQRLWFLDRIEERSDLYNVPLTLELVGRLDKGALRESFDAIVARHDVLRTTFPDVDGVPYQFIAAVSDPLSREWEEVDLGTDAGEEEVESLLRRHARRPFHLARGPLFRVGLFRRGDEDHVLQVVMHHSVSDGWSVGVFGRELSALYSAFVAGDPSPLPPLPIQYLDYSAWQQERLQGETLEGQLEYWHEELADLTPLELPTDRPRPPFQSFAGRGLRFHLPKGLADGLRALSLQEGSTLFMTLMAAFQLLLSRYSGQADIAVGTPTAGRIRSELEGMIGMFVNTLVIRSGLSGDLTFKEVLAQVRETSLEAQAHQDLPFEKLVEELQPQRDPSRNPLFQVMFSLQTTEMEEISLPGLTARSLDSGGTTSTFDLSLFLWEREEAGGTGAIEGVWTYATDLFDTSTIERMKDHFQRLLGGIVGDPDAPVGSLALMGEEERRVHLEEWSQGPCVAIPEGRCAQHLFEAQVEDHPDQIAVVAKDGTLTYGELETRANQLAHHLLRLGVGPETLVGVGLPRTTDMVVSVMGILKAGGAYLPLDPDLPGERLNYMLEDAGSSFVVTTKELEDRFPSVNGHTLCLDREGEAIGALSGLRPDVGVDPGHLAYVLYTSGSTGKPKGVEVRHTSVVNFLLSMAQRPGLSSEDVLLAVTRLSFDVSVMEIFGMLSVGARVVLASQEVAGDGHKLQALMADSGANLMTSTPATWRMLLQAGWDGKPDLRALVGGEAFPLDLARDLEQRCREVWNGYGPTEATVYSALWKVPRDVDQIRIGTPTNNTQLHVLDPRMQLVPAGTPGELYIGGAAVTPGYRDRPELTAERFVADPFSERPGAKLYRTGDRVRFRDDGTLEYLGRLDDQVKVRGFRIELGEIETVLAGHEAVRHGAVGVHGEDVEARLVSYVVFEAGEGLTSTELRRFLRRSLPDYMVPGLLIELDELPLTPSGKVDRKALPHPIPEAPGGARDYVPPETPEETLISEVWKDLLDVDRVGRKDNFFEIGGHSLLSIQAVAIIEKKSGHRLDPRAMFFQTVEQLARSLGTGPES